MKHYGDVSLQSATSLVMSSESVFPASPTAGRIVFVDKRVWICAEVGGTDPIWVPLTNQLDTYIGGYSSASWTVVHNLGTSTPLVQVYDGNNTIIPSNIEIVDSNTLTVSFDGVSVTGRAVVMYGNIVGSTKPQYTYTHTQSDLSDTWVIAHGLGYSPIVRVFIADEEIQPQSIIHTNSDQTIVTFSSTRVGIARLI